MKKLFAITLIASMLALPGLALASSEDTKVVGEGEVNIVSVSVDEEVPVVGEDIEIGEDEVKILTEEEEVPYDEIIAYSGLPEKEKNNTLPLIIGAGALVLVAGGIVVKKKMKTNN